MDYFSSIVSFPTSKFLSSYTSGMNGVRKKASSRRLSSRSKFKKKPKTVQGSEEDAGITRCICGYDHDDGHMICCDSCNVWQHLVCVGIDPLNTPKFYYCDKCSNRTLDVERAKRIQSLKVKELHSSELQEKKLLRLDSSHYPSNFSRYKKRLTTFNKDKEILLDDECPLQSKKKHKEFSSSVRNKSIEHKRRERLKKSHNLDASLDSCLYLSPKSSLFLNESYREIYSAMFAESAYYNRFYTPLSVCLTSEAIRAHLKAADESDFFLDHSSRLEYSPIDVGYKYAGTSLLYKSLAAAAPFEPVVKGALPQLNNFKKVLVLEAESVDKNQFLTEFIGEWRFITDFDAEWKKDSSLYQRSRFRCPFVLYRPMLGLCIDASRYGSVARYVRRSCRPNAEVREFYKKEMNGDRGEVCVGLFSLKPIAKGEEITIDFDYDYYDTAYSVYCSCDFDTCIIPFTAPRKASLSAVSNSALLNLGDDQKILQKDFVSPELLKETRFAASCELSSQSTVAVLSQEKQLIRYGKKLWIYEYLKELQENCASRQFVLGSFDAAVSGINKNSYLGITKGCTNMASITTVGLVNNDEDKINNNSSNNDIDNNSNNNSYNNTYNDKLDAPAFLGKTHAVPPQSAPVSDKTNIPLVKEKDGGDECLRKLVPDTTPVTPHVTLNHSLHPPITDTLQEGRCNERGTDTQVNTSVGDGSLEKKNGKRRVISLKDYTNRIKKLHGAESEASKRELTFSCNQLQTTIPLISDSVVEDPCRLASI